MADYQYVRIVLNSVFFKSIMDQCVGPPVLQIPDAVYQQVVGSNVTIQVSVLANPLANGVWMFGGSVIDSSDPKYTNSSESFLGTFQTNFSLEITNLQIEDSGEYSLMVSNVFETRVATVLLDVQCKCVVRQSLVIPASCRH